MKLFHKKQLKTFLKGDVLLKQSEDLSVVLTVAFETHLLSRGGDVHEYTSKKCRPQTVCTKLRFHIADV